MCNCARAWVRPCASVWWFKSSVLFKIVFWSYSYIDKLIKMSKWFKSSVLFKIVFCSYSYIDKSIKMVNFKLGNEMWRYINQHDTSVEKRKLPSPGQEAIPWPPEHRQDALSTALRELVESNVIKLSSYMTGILHSTKINTIEDVMSSDKLIKMVNLGPFLSGTQNFSFGSTLVLSWLIHLSLRFSTCTNPIIHLFYPPKICIRFVLDYSWDTFMSQEKL